jgi:hypothetical protein
LACHLQVAVAGNATQPARPPVARARCWDGRYQRSSHAVSASTRHYL